MTRTARYNAKTNTFRELPEMEKPKRPCPICKGQGVIPRPEIKNMQP